MEQKMLEEALKEEKLKEVNKNLKLQHRSMSAEADTQIGQLENELKESRKVLAALEKKKQMFFFNSDMLSEIQSAAAAETTEDAGFNNNNNKDPSLVPYTLSNHVKKKKSKKWKSNSEEEYGLLVEKGVAATHEVVGLNGDTAPFLAKSGDLSESNNELRNSECCCVVS